ncbi:hypothetical protein FHR85_002273 [Alkalibacillus almallahensis]|nr:hypothetical protein [Alkalibacillus almallahensis]
MKKLYVREEKWRNAEGERLVDVETFFSQPKRFDYILFI